MAEAAERVLVLDGTPTTRRDWLAEVRAHTGVLIILARKDFHVRYKRASLGLLWVVGFPVLQGAVMALVFSRVIKDSLGAGYAAYILSGILAWTYFATTLTSSSTAIVDGSDLTDKVWFPRVILVFVPPLANLTGFGVSMVVLLTLAQLLGSPLTANVLWLVPAITLLMSFTVALSMVLAALHVYFRDTKFFVQAVLLVWLYATPILYPKELLGSLATVVDLNPMTGIVALFHHAIVESNEPLLAPVTVSVIFSVVLAVVGLETQRRRDRLFVDQL